MKNNVGIWIDGTKAVIVDLKTDSVKEIAASIDNKVHHESSEGDKGNFVGSGHHINNEKKFDERKKHQVHAYLKEVMGAIKGAEGVYIFGPAEMKTHLKTEIENDHALSKALLACESADKLTDNQIVAAVKKYFTPVKK